MKKKIFMMLFLLVSLTANAQQTFKAMGKDVSFGMRGGITTSYLTNNDNSDGKMGWCFGVDFTVPFDEVCKNFSVQPSVLFVSKGDVLSQDGDVGDGDYANTEATINAVYMEIPITAAYKIQLGRRFNITLNTGPYIAFGLGGKSKLETNATIGGSPISGGFDKGTFESCKRFDYGWVFGIRYGFTKTLSAGVQFDLGMCNTAKEDGKEKNFAGLLYVGWTF